MLAEHVIVKKEHVVAKKERCQEQVSHNQMMEKVTQDHLKNCQLDGKAC